MSRLIAVFLLVLSLFPLAARSAEPLTVAESSNYTRTATYAEVMDFIFAMQRRSEMVRVVPLTRSSEGRMIPLLILSKEGAATPAEVRAAGKPLILIMANIHAGEIEGKEASLMLLREIVSGERAALLEKQTVLLLPIFNADGNERFGRNRGDNGPELAGVRYNGQNLDLNRDYLKMESPEITALIRLFNTWDPLLVVDMHTTNGSYHRNPVTYATQSNPNTAPALRDYMWARLFPAVSAALKNQYGFDSIPYGNFRDREDFTKGWENDAIDARFGTNYVGLRNRFAILDENYTHADYKTRVLGAHALVRAILEYTAVHGAEMADLARRADDETRRAFAAAGFAWAYEVERLLDVTIKSYEFEKVVIPPEDRAKYPPWVGDFFMKPTDKPKEYRNAYFSLARPTRTLPLPTGYIIPPFQTEVIDNLRRHGIRLETVQQEYSDEVEQFRVEKLELEKTIYQGHVLSTFHGAYEKATRTIPAGSVFVDMHQPLARLVPVLLEPQSGDSLAVWGFFNRVIVRQWSNEPQPYPVWRVQRRPSSSLLLLE